ncbi:MAG: sulfite exporter TauE/SafE family protein [Pseudomonadota bacterium]
MEKTLEIGNFGVVGVTIAPFNSKSTIVFQEYEIWVLAWCFFALLCGGFIKGAMGVGTPLLTVPMMAMVLPPQTAIVIMAIPVVVANVVQFAQAERSFDVVQRFWPMFVSILIGVIVGTKILIEIDENTLLVVVGLAVIAFALLQLSSFRLSLTESMIKPAGVLFGTGAGLIGGLSSFLGPLMIIYMISIPNLSKDKFVSSISFLYISGVVPWAIVLYLLGLLRGDIFYLSAIATIPVALGLFFGQQIRRFISESFFKKLIVAILVVSGLSMLWRATQI